MTGDTTGAANAAAGACMFAGDSFTVLGGTMALCDVYLNVFSNLTVVAGGTISAFTGQGRANVLRGNTLTLLQSSTSPSALISCQGGAWLVVENELLGSADLDIGFESPLGKGGEHHYVLGFGWKQLYVFLILSLCHGISLSSID